MVVQWVRIHLPVQGTWVPSLCIWKDHATWQLGACTTARCPCTRLSFAGQMTGVEGYVESAASGMLVGIETAARVLGLESVDFPQETAIGALALYISGGSVGDFQPMNINFGIITPLDHRVKGKRNKNAEISKRSLEIIERLKEKEVFHCEDHH